MPIKDKGALTAGCDNRGRVRTATVTRSAISGRFVKRRDRGEVRESVKESVKRSAKKNAAVWAKLSKY